MKIRAELSEAIFVRRLNRFAAMVEVGGKQEVAHLPNSGRMRELLFPGARVLVAERSGERKTRFDLLMAEEGSTLVSVDSRLPPVLVAEALAEGRLPELGEFHTLRREVRVGASRLDLLGHGARGSCLMETKSVTLVRDGVALFPDAPTSRGTRHLEQLRRATTEGCQAAAIFVIQRDDASSFSPLEEADPVFASALRSISTTVQILAYGCRVCRDQIAIVGRVPVAL